MTTTAGDQINAALRLIGMLAEGETPSADTSQDALTAFDQMIDSWSIERLSVFCTQDQVFVWPTNTASRTIGPSGNFVGERPILVDSSTYFVDSNNLSFGIQQINEDQYNGIALKNSTSTYPEVMYVNNDFPNATMYVYPVPTSALTFHIVSAQPLDQPALLSTTLSFPPGYLRAFKYNLACEIAAEFGIEPPSTVKRIAVASKRSLKRINNPNDVMAIPSVLVQNRQRYNIFTNNF